MKYLVVITALLISTVAHAQSPPAGATDDIAQNFFAPDLVLKYREVIGLDETQSKALKELVQEPARSALMRWTCRHKALRRLLMLLASRDVGIQTRHRSRSPSKLPS